MFMAAAAALALAPAWPYWPPMVGDESGLEASARVEWCRLVAAREKSKPRDRRGKILVGDAYVCAWSSLGESGAAGLLAYGERGSGEAAGEVGMCSARPRREKPVRWGVTGLDTEADVEDSRRLLSSLDVRRDASIICGDGERSLEGVPPPSDMDRALDGDRVVAILVAWESPPP
jgi:hypothetical protein